MPEPDKISRPEEMDWLDARLREELPYIDDAGFTARVMARVPARRARSFLRAGIVLGATLLALALAWVLSNDGQLLRTGFAFLASLPILQLLGLALVTGVVVMGAGLTAALAKQD